MKLFLVGALGGAIVGYLIGNSRLEQEYEKRYNEALDNARDWYERKYNPEKFEPKEEPREVVVVERGVTAEPEDIPEPVESVVPDEVVRAVTDYRGMYTAPSVLSQEKVRSEVPDPREDVEVAVQKATNGPTIISAEEFHENVTGYNQVQLTYYHGDDIVSNAADNAIEEINRRFMFGDDVIDVLKEGLPPGEDTLYVRSPHIMGGQEYEIYWEPGSYSELIGPFKSGSVK